MKQQLAIHGYDIDFCAWAMEQAQLLRDRQFDLLDVKNIAEEIESLAKHERQELASRLQVLLCHLLKWQYQPERRGPSLSSAILTQRHEIDGVLLDSPSLLSTFHDDDWLQRVWRHAVALAEQETGLDRFPLQCPWRIHDEVLSGTWFP